MSESGEDETIRVDLGSSQRPTETSHLLWPMEAFAKTFFIDSTYFLSRCHRSETGLRTS